jgi:hypothetical protein
MNFQKKCLQWILDFIQTDLSGLSRREKYKLFKEVVYFSSDSFFNKTYFLNSALELIEGYIEFSQNKFKAWEDIASEIQTTLKEFFNEMAINGAYGLPELSAFIRAEALLPPSDHRLYSQFRITFHPKNPTPKNWAIVNFAKLINGIEMHVLGKCPKCGKWFLNFSLRKKNYCSPKCASSSLALTRKQRWSEKDYDTYLKKQNKLSKKRYIEKRKAEKKPYRPRPKKRGKKMSVKVL